MKKKESDSTQDSASSKTSVSKKAAQQPEASEADGNVHTQRVGRRLMIIREELRDFWQQRGQDGQDWSQTGVGRQVGLTQNIITRMEHGKGGLIENWLILLSFYAGLGYNLNWILTEDNQRITKLQINESTAGQIRDEVLGKLSAMRESTLQGIDELYKRVDMLTAEGETSKSDMAILANSGPDLSFLHD